MMDAVLTLELAKSIAELNPPADEWPDYLDLSAYSKADFDAIRFLADQGQRGAVALGLAELDVATATIVANWSTSINLDNLRRMSPEVAAVLAVNWNYLDIKGLEELSIEVAEELAKNQSHLFISLRGVISLEVAHVLAGHTHELWLEVAAKPPLDAQRALLLSYTGRKVMLRYPFDEAASISDFADEEHKMVVVERLEDQSGGLWTDITATDEVERWQKRLLNQSHSDSFG